MAAPRGHRPSAGKKPVPLSEAEVAELALLEEEVQDLRAKRPLTRGDCLHGPRPCPWVSCKHHLYLDVDHEGRLRVNTSVTGPWDLGERTSCALDVIDDFDYEGKAPTHQQIADWTGAARETVKGHLPDLLAELSCLGGAATDFDSFTTNWGVNAIRQYEEERQMKRSRIQATYVPREDGDEGTYTVEVIVDLVDDQGAFVRQLRVAHLVEQVAVDYVRRVSGKLKEKFHARSIRIVGGPHGAE